jgi:hypothetical protein
MPNHMNPAEFLIELMNIDFASHQEAAQDRLEAIQKGWTKSAGSQELSTHIESTLQNVVPLPPLKISRHNFAITLMTLVHRSFIKSYRDVIAYGIRIAMYIGLAILMGTVWLRLDYDQSDIQSFTNSTFYGGAFMSFMAVAYIPGMYIMEAVPFLGSGLELQSILLSSTSETCPTVRSF